MISDIEAAEFLGLKDADGQPNGKAFQNLARTKRVPAKKIGRYWRSRRSWLERYLEGEDAKAISDRTDFPSSRQAH
jgi:hypothetical protein